MRNLTAVLTTLLLTVVLVHGQGAGPKIEGTWNLIGANSKGTKIPDAIFAKFKGTMTLKDGSYQQAQMGTTIETGKYKIDASKMPGLIDLDILTGEDKGKK